MAGTTGGTGSAATDETDQLIASTKIEGTAVYNRQGERLGTVASFMVDKRSGQVAYAVMSFGGFLGLGQSCHPLPWHVLSYDTGQGGSWSTWTKNGCVPRPGSWRATARTGPTAPGPAPSDAYYAGRPDRPRDEQAIDDAVDDSFPASDPPVGGADHEPPAPEPVTNRF